MAIPAINVLGNPNVTEGNFQIAIEDLRKSVIGSGKAYDSSNTYSQYDTCVSGGIVYYSKINSNTGNTPIVGVNWGLIGDLITGVVHNVGNETIAGIKTFSTSPIVPTPTTTGNVITMDNIIQKTAVGIGYGTGSDGAVTQLTSKSTSVTLNKPSGRITLNNSAIPANSSVIFVFNNSLIAPADSVICNTVAGTYITVNAYDIKVEAVGYGICFIVIENKTMTALSEAVQLNFTVIKGANS